MPGVVLVIPSYYHDDLMYVIKPSKEMKETFNGRKQLAINAFRGTVLSGFGAFLGGPFGALGGGLLGLVVGYFEKSPYDSMIEALEKLEQKRKEELSSRVINLVGSASAHALSEYIKEQERRSALINILKSYT